MKATHNFQSVWVWQKYLRFATTVSENVPRFRALGISPRSLEDELEAILRQNKPRVLLP
jgi:hypothetical protein